MDMDYGFIYVLRNESMPDLYKIGMTTVHPKIRANQIAGATACPQKFELMLYADTTCVHEEEKHLHNFYESHRVNNNREFFKFNPEVLYDDLFRYIKSSYRRVILCDDYYTFAYENGLSNYTERD